MAIKARNSVTGKSVRANKSSPSFHTDKLAGRSRIVLVKAQHAQGKQSTQFRELTVPQQRVGFLTQALGTQSRVADLLEVSRSQLGKWSRGEEAPSPERARELIDLDHVVARVVSWLGSEMTISWLNGSNAFLEGARPIDVLRMRGSSEVVNAIDVETSGAFA